MFCLVLACGVNDPLPAEPTPDPTASADQWPYDSLNAEERAVVDRGRDVRAWHRVHRGFADAVAAQAKSARGGR